MATDTFEKEINGITASICVGFHSGEPEEYGFYFIEDGRLIDADFDEFDNLDEEIERRDGYTRLGIHFSKGKIEVNEIYGFLGTTGACDIVVRGGIATFKNPVKPHRNT